MNKFKCPECGGSGGHTPKHDGDTGWTCPTCQGSGNVMLEVVVQPRHDDNAEHAHPLTVAEVEEYRDTMQVEYNGLISDKQLIEYIHNGQGIPYKGQPVQLAPWKEEPDGIEAQAQAKEL